MRISEFAAATLLIAACGCSGGGGGIDSVASRTTPLCDQIAGMEAIAWEYYNGVIVVDSVLPPLVDDIGGTYSHTDFPLLGFSYPVGWIPTEIRDANTQGVDLIREDEGAIWRSVSVTVSGVPNVASVRDFELGLSRDFFGIAGAYQVVCELQASGEVSPGTGIVTSVDNVLVRADDRTILLTTSVTQVPGLPTSSIAVRHMSAPSAEFQQRLLDTFMAIDWQMLIGDTEGTNDRDGDGWLDQFDQFPDDPMRH